MYSISDKQIDFILSDIRARGVEMEDLQFNLLDHVCCIIEQNLEANGDFEHFYQRTIKQFYKHELWEIEEETISLQIFKHYYTMKKIMIGTGIVSALLMIAGIFFKFMHWPGAAMFLVLGIGTSSIFFLPLLFMLKAKEKKAVKDKIIVGIGTLAGILMSLGILFKVMHWPGANVMGMAAIIMMLLIFLPVYFFSGIRNPDTRVNTLVSTILIIMGCGLFLTLVNTRPSIKYQNSIAYSNQRVSDSYDYLTLQNNKAFETLASDSALKKNGLNEMRTECDRVCKQIEEMKLELVSVAEGTDVSKVNYYALTLGDNFDIPTSILFDKQGNAGKKLLDLKKNLAMLNEMASSKFQVSSNKLIDLGDRSSVQEEGVNEPWEVSTFYHTPTSLVLKNFSQLQLDVRIVESNCLTCKDPEKIAALIK